MACTLVVNPGSSSKKYAVYVDGVLSCSMKFERTASGYEQCTEVGGVRQKCEGVSVDTYGSALEHFLAELVLAGAITHSPDVGVVVVRVVVPGTYFQRHTPVTDEYVHALRQQESLAPLHVPHTLREIDAVQTLLPSARLIAASDSAFHSSMPFVARSYSVTKADSERHDLYRFGYHGLSVASVARRHHSVVGREPSAVVVCHLGSGVSVTAVKDGKSIETTMGYAPGTGVVMATRAGDVDAGALLSLMQQKNWRPIDAQTYLNHSGGLFGVAGEADLRVVMERAAQGEPQAAVALEMYLYQVVQGIARCVAALGGMRSLVFTATAGERNPVLRAKILERLAYLGVYIDSDKNEQIVSKDGVISSSQSTVKVAVIRTDEMGEMYTVAKSVLG